MSENLITLADGANMTALYRNKKEEILMEEYRYAGILPICESFNRDVFDQLLANEAVKGIRIYAGMTEDLQQNFIVVGVDENDEDVYLYPVPGQQTEAYVIDNSIRCPDRCPPPSALNS